MGEVVELRPRNKPAEQVWGCNCGGQFFWLLRSGEIQCVDCYTIQTPRHFDPTEQPS